LLKKLLKIEGFKDKVIDSAQITKNSGYETGFVSFIIDGKTVLGDVVVGNCDSVMPETGIEQKLRESFMKKSRIEIDGLFHFHPSDQLIVPSDDDLLDLFWRIRDGQLIKPTLNWMITGRVTDRINLLCLSPGTTSESDFREWVRFTDSLSSFYFNEGLQEEINFCLEDLGFNVDYLTL
jgi:hypothetical protein